MNVAFDNGWVAVLQAVGPYALLIAVVLWRLPGILHGAADIIRALNERKALEKRAEERYEALVHDVVRHIDGDREEDG